MQQSPDVVPVDLGGGHFHEEACAQGRGPEGEVVDRFAFTVEHAATVLRVGELISMFSAWATMGSAKAALTSLATLPSFWKLPAISS